MRSRTMSVLLVARLRLGAANGGTIHEGGSGGDVPNEVRGGL